MRTVTLRVELKATSKGLCTVASNGHVSMDLKAGEALATEVFSQWKSVNPSGPLQQVKLCFSPRSSITRHHTVVSTFTAYQKWDAHRQKNVTVVDTEVAGESLERRWNEPYDPWG